MVYRVRTSCRTIDSAQSMATDDALSIAGTKSSSHGTCQGSLRASSAYQALYAAGVSDLGIVQTRARNRSNSLQCSYKHKRLNSIISDLTKQTESSIPASQVRRDRWPELEAGTPAADCGSSRWVKCHRSVEPPARQHRPRCLGSVPRV